MSNNFFPLTAEELFNRINKIPKVKLAMLPTSLEYLPNISKELEINFEKEQKGDVKYTNADISKSKKLINYKPSRNIKYGLTQQYEYIKTNLNFYDD